MDRCKHCQKNRPYDNLYYRGLCQGCYNDKDVRDLYPKLAGMNNDPHTSLIDHIFHSTPEHVARVKRLEEIARGREAQRRSLFESGGIACS